MSRTMFASFPGAATAIGLVESKRSTPPQGAMWLALPTARYSPIMSCASGIAAYSDAGPAWLLRLTPTQAAPAVLAFAIAVFAAKLITTCPMPLSPSTSAMPAASRATLTFGFTLTAPPLMRRTYCGSRKIPCPSAPWRSARAISSAQVAASFTGRPTASRASAVKRLRWAAGRRCEAEFTACVSGWRDMPNPTMRAKAQQRSMAPGAAAGRGARVRSRSDHHPAQRRRQGEPVFPARLQSRSRDRLPHHDRPHAGEPADARARPGLFRHQLPPPRARVASRVQEGSVFRRGGRLFLRRRRRHRLLHQDAEGNRFVRARQQRPPARDGRELIRCRPGPSALRLRAIP